MAYDENGRAYVCEMRDYPYTDKVHHQRNQENPTDADVGMQSSGRNSGLALYECVRLKKDQSLRRLLVRPAIPAPPKQKLRAGRCARTLRPREFQLPAAAKSARS